MRVRTPTSDRVWQINPKNLLVDVLYTYMTLGTS